MRQEHTSTTLYFNEAVKLANQIFRKPTSYHSLRVRTLRFIAQALTIPQWHEFRKPATEVLVLYLQSKDDELAKAGLACAQISR